MKIKPIIWQLLLQIKSIYSTINLGQEIIVIDENFCAKKCPQPNFSNKYKALIYFNQDSESNADFYTVLFTDTVSKKTRKIFSLYLGYILVNKKSNLPFSCVHFAQTLDGKTATVTGQSKWIGNKENLVHAHRIRALVDAVLVGGNTYRIDKPRLDVRLVTGENPIKIIISNSKIDLKSLVKGKTYLCSAVPLEYENLPEETELIYIDSDQHILSTKRLLSILKSKGIHSVLIEGGAQTIKSFMQEKVISRIEFHTAPILFGSGKNSVELGEIQELDEAIVLKEPKYYKMGNAMMTVSNLHY